MKKVSKINAVLIELIIVILFFAIASVITIQLFAKSYSITTESTAKTRLTTVVENQMNEYRNNKGEVGKRTLFFDEEFNPCEQDKAYYIEEIDAVKDSELPLINVKVSIKDVNDKGIMSFDTSYERQV